MRTIVCTACCALLVCVFGSNAGEQPKPAKPGPEHAKFKARVGVWDAVCDSMGKESKGTSQCMVGLNGLWLFEHFQGEFGGQKYEGKGALTYDADKKKYMHIWIDSWSTTPMVSEGTMDKDNRMVLKGEMTHDGKKMPVILTTEMKDDNHVTFTMATPGPDGKEMQMMKISYTRKESKKSTD